MDFKKDVMNLHVITKLDLKKFQIESYSEMLKNPRSDNHKKFLKKEIKRLQNDMDNTGSIGNGNNFQSLEMVQKRSERFC